MQVERGTAFSFYEFNLNNQTNLYNNFCAPRIANVWYIGDLQTKIFPGVAGVVNDPGQGPDLKWDQQKQYKTYSQKINNRIKIIWLVRGSGEDGWWMMNDDGWQYGN